MPSPVYAYIPSARRPSWRSYPYLRPFLGSVKMRIFGFPRGVEIPCCCCPPSISWIWRRRRVSPMRMGQGKSTLIDYRLQYTRRSTAVHSTQIKSALSPAPAHLSTKCPSTRAFDDANARRLC
ncbi:hypothetical protein PSCLAVI8L_50130 [Pseudoclavibacter sp. 8L]|nr:hypothetical protein PSCLAVI8L_50130 [Pseudoclavibacter sp. 8L]